MELKSSACDVQCLGMLHMDVHCQILRFLHLIHSRKIHVPTTMLSGAHHYGLTILVVARGVCGVEKFLIMDRMHQTMD